jgi:hypothetical protein
MQALVIRRANQGKAPKKQRKSSGSEQSEVDAFAEEDGELVEVTPKVFPSSRNDLTNTLTLFAEEQKVRHEREFAFKEKCWQQEMKQREKENDIKMQQVENERLRLEIEREKLRALPR